MRIAVSARLLIQNNMTGIGWFIFETMQRIVEQHPEHEFIYFFDRPYSHQFITAKNIRPVVLKPKCRFHPLFYRLWYDIKVYRALNNYKIDFFIAPEGIMSLRTSVPTLLVIHDLAFVHYPHFIPKYMSEYLIKTTGKCCQKAFHIATVSEYSRNDIHQIYGVPKEKISVVFNGTHHHFNPIGDEEKLEIKKTYAQGEEYFLFVGTIHPRKNLMNQLIAYERFRNENPETRHKFIIVGTRWIVEEKLQEFLDNTKYSADILFYGHMPTEKLSKLTASAFALMYVSVFEGFGIPIIEGFQAEVPVITSNTSSMPEVAGDAAMIVEPSDPESIFSAMNALFKNPELRQKFIERGRIRKELFSWEKTARLFNDALEISLGKISKRD